MLCRPIEGFGEGKELDSSFEVVYGCKTAPWTMKLERRVKGGER